MTGRIPLRLRVALAFAAASAVALTGLGVFLSLRVEHTLEDQTRSSLDSQLDALAALPADGRAEAVRQLSGATFGQVYAGDGTLDAGSPQLDRPLVDAGELPAEGTELTLSRDVRIVGDDEAEPSLLLLRGTDDGVLLVGASLEPVEEALDGILAALLIGGPLALLVASAAGYLVAGYALRPIEQMRRRAATISALDPGERLPLPAADDEVRRLGATLNEMLDRLEAALVRERHFVAEASHELRTPLALLRTELDLALARPRSSDELVTALRSASEEVQRLTHLSRDLLELAAAEDGAREPVRDTFAIGALLEEVAARFAGHAREEGRSITVAGEDCPLSADRDRVERALGNLVDNALRHGDGGITLSARRSGERVLVSVADRGTGMDPGFRPRAFDRFSRQPGTRSTGDGGGLGLAIVRAIAEEHGGTARVEDSGPGEGTVVLLALPANEPGLRQSE